MTTRRQFLRGGGTASLLLSMPAIARRAEAEPSRVARLRAKDLPTPNFAELRANAQFDVGLRPHRTGGIRLSLTPLQDGSRFLIHNYGHSGAGITLAWGCASVVVDYVEAVLNRRRGSQAGTAVAILGSGVIGLTTATELRRRWPQLPITIYAKGAAGAAEPDLTKTTSFIAGGEFEPAFVTREYEGSNRPLLTAFLRGSAKRLREIEASGRAGDFGIARRKSYALDDEDNPSLDEFTPSDVVPPYRRGLLPFREMRASDGTRQIGREYSTWLINPRILLPKLAADLSARNVARRAMTFESVQQVEALSENIIVNCTGLGAKTLFGDQNMIPKRGLLVRLPNVQRRFNYFFSGGCQNDEIAYFFARQTDLVIGGTNRSNQDSEVVSEHDRDVCGRLIDNMERIFNGRSNQCVVPDPR